MINLNVIGLKIPCTQQRKPITVGVPSAYNTNTNSSNNNN